MGAPPSLLLPCNHRETVHAINRHLRDHSSWCPAIMICCNIGPFFLYPILRATLLLLPRQTFLLLNMGRERSRKILFVSKIDTWRLLANTARALHPPLAAHFLDFVHLLTLGRDFVRKVRYDNNSRPRVGRPPSEPGDVTGEGARTIWPRDCHDMTPNDAIGRGLHATNGVSLLTSLEHRRGWVRYQRP